MKHYVDDRGHVQSIDVADMPSEEYVHNAVVDRQPVTLEDVLMFLLEYLPVLKMVFRIFLVYVWVWLLYSLYVELF